MPSIRSKKAITNTDLADYNQVVSTRNKTRAITARREHDHVALHLSGCDGRAISKSFGYIFTVSKNGTDPKNPRVRRLRVKSRQNAQKTEKRLAEGGEPGKSSLSPSCLLLFHISERSQFSYCNTNSPKGTRRQDEENAAINYRYESQ